MKCKQLIRTYYVITDDCVCRQMLLEPDTEAGKKGMWNLVLEDDEYNYCTVNEMYKFVQSIFEHADEKEICGISVKVLDEWQTIFRTTSREEYLSDVIGDTSCCCGIIMDEQ